MAWVWPAFRSKQAFIDDIDEGWQVILYPGSDEEGIPKDGEITVEGPDRDHPPIWWATVTMEDGLITDVR